VDECKIREAGCDLKNGVCKNTAGSYECTCHDGYEFKTPKEKMCSGGLLLFFSV